MIFHGFSDLAWSHYFPKIFLESRILIDTDILLGKLSNLDWNWDLKKTILILAWWVKICLALPWPTRDCYHHVPNNKTTDTVLLSPSALNRNYRLCGQPQPKVRWVGRWADGGVCVCVGVGGGRGGRYMVHITRWMVSQVLSLLSISNVFSVRGWPGRDILSSHGIQFRNNNRTW